jgi:hypothetical protein
VWSGFELRAGRPDEKVRPPCKAEARPYPYSLPGGGDCALRVGSRPASGARGRAVAGVAAASHELAPRSLLNLNLATWTRFFENPAGTLSVIAYSDGRVLPDEPRRVVVNYGEFPELLAREDDPAIIDRLRTTAAPLPAFAFVGARSACTCPSSVPTRSSEGSRFRRGQAAWAAFVVEWTSWVVRRLSLWA